MWNQKGGGNGNNNNNNMERKCEGVTVAIDKDKGSQYALKWAVDHLLSRGQTVTLIHVKQRPSSIPTPMGNHVPLTDVHNEVAKAIKNQTDSQAKEIFLPFRTFCTRKDIKTNEIITEDSDVARALCDYVKINLIDTLVVGSPSRNSFVRFKTSDVPTSVSRGAPEFCNVYVISKGKISSVRSASIAVPTQQSRLQNQNIPAPAPRPTTDGRSFPTSTSRAADRIPFGPRTPSDDQEIKSPFNRNRESNRSYGDLSMVDTDISFVSSNRPSTDRMGGGFSSPFDRQEMGPTLRLSLGLDNRNNFMSPLPTPKSQETSYMKGFSSSDEETSTSWPSSNKVW